LPIFGFSLTMIPGIVYAGAGDHIVPARLSTTRNQVSQVGELMPRLPDTGRRLLLYIEGNKRTTLKVPLTDRLLIGRSDQDSPAVPGLDLAPYSGEAGGVSRNHAALIYEDEGVFIEDLGSTNGTRLNGLQLAPHEPYRLRSGDELEFGSIRITVRF
jgi:FHA domain-containing protein